LIQKKAKAMLFVDAPPVAASKKQHTVHPETTFCAYIAYLHSGNDHKKAILASVKKKARKTFRPLMPNKFVRARSVFRKMSYL
jgi:hypothetical protein